MSSLAAGYGAGLTALDVWSISTRLAAFIHLFRHRYGLAITTVREAHEDGWHARYRLTSRVTLHVLR